MNNILTQHTNLSNYKQPDLVAMLLNDKRSENTKRAYRFDIDHFFIYLTGSKSTSINVHKFTSLPRNKALEIVLTYKNWLITNEKLAESTINRKIYAIRSLVSLAKTLGYCDYDLSEVDHETEETDIWIIRKGRGTQKESITISNLLVCAINDYLFTRQKNTILTANESLFATTDRRTAGSRMSGEALRRLVRNIAIQAG